jgi:hypothetical protein
VDVSVPDDRVRRTNKIARITEVLVKGHCLSCEPAGV